MCSEHNSIVPPHAGSTIGEMPIAFIEYALDGPANQSRFGCGALSRRNRISGCLEPEVGI